MSRYRRLTFIICAGLLACTLIVHWKFNRTHVKEAESDTQSLISNFEPGKSRSRVVFYNRVGKCGSRSILYLSMRLAKLNKFKYDPSRDFSHDHPSRNETIKEMKKIARLRPPVLYNRHIHYLDFEKHGLPQPIYINVVRDPIDRFSSQYNYLKYGDGGGQVVEPETGWPDINDCVMKNMGICATNFMFYTGLYFCGFDKVCDTPSRARVDLAKKHIAEEYAVIGLMEEFNNTLILLEKMLPEYFLGAVGNFDPNAGWRKITITKKRDFLTEESKEKLRTIDMKDEYEVYFHARRKFEALKKKYGVND